jgi:biopolymer transport protein ExbD
MNAIDLSATTPRKARIEIIPLIDVIFFLLATFVLFTLSLSKIAAIGVQMPQPGLPTPIDRTVYIQASDNGTFYWKQGKEGTPEFFTANELAPRLQYYARHEPSPRVFVRGDDKAKFGPALMVIDQVRKAGITQVSIETRTSASGH